jgi:hypothetical protein
LSSPRCPPHCRPNTPVELRGARSRTTPLGDSQPGNLALPRLALPPTAPRQLQPVVRRLAAS